MGKRKKVDINGEPLQSVTIGIIKPPKFVGFKVIVLFLLFIGVIYFMDDVSKFINSYILGKSSGDPVVVHPSGNEKDTGINIDEQPDEIVTYLLDGASTIDLTKDAKVTISNATLNETGTLSLTVSTKENTVSLDSSRLYLMLYNDDNQVIKYIRLKGVISSNQPLLLTYDNITAARYNVKLLTEKEYPIYTFDSEQEKSPSFTCQKDTKKITYYFNNDKLYMVDYNVTIPKTDANYDNEYSLHNQLYLQTKDKLGYTASFGTTFDNLEFKLKVDYTQTSDPAPNDLFYKKGVSANVIMFELDSEFYNCR